MLRFDQVWESLLDDEKASVAIFIVGIKLRPFLTEKIEAISS